MSWFFSSKKPKYPGKYAIVPQVVQFCLSSELFREMDSIIADLSKDGAMGSDKEEEFKLAYTEKHAQWVSSFESRLEDFIRSKKSTPEEFYAICKKATDMEDDNIQTFLDLLFQMLEFRTFMDLTRDPQKRAFVKQILAHYSKALTE